MGSSITVNFSAKLGPNVLSTKSSVKNGQRQFILERKNCFLTVDFTSEDDVYYDNSMQTLVVTNGFPVFKNKKIVARDFLKYYKIYGEQLLEQIEGLFCILMVNDDHFLVLTDPLGTKAVYYRLLDKSNAVVATEFKKLVSFGKAENELNRHALAHFLAYGSVSTPETLVKHVYKVPQGTAFSFNLDSCDTTLLKKYDVLEKALACYNNPVQLTSKMLLEKIVDLTRLGCEDKPEVSMLLSGGVDSAAIAAVVRKCLGIDVKAFNVAFPNESYERSRVQKVAEYLGIDLRTFDITAKDVMNAVKTLPSLFDEPSGDVIASTPYLYALNQIPLYTTDDTLLSGWGCDDVLFGFSWFFRRKYILDILLKSRLDYFKGVVHKCAKLTSNYNLIKLDPEYHVYSVFWLASPNLLNKILPGSVETVFGDTSSMLDKLLPMDSLTRMYSVTNFVTTARFGALSKNPTFEMYTPLRNNMFTEFSYSIPTALKTKNNITKYVLRKMLSDYNLLPKDVIYQRKIGLGSALLETVFKGEALDFCIEELENNFSTLQDYVNLKAVKKAISEKTKFVEFKYALYVLTDFLKHNFA